MAVDRNAPTSEIGATTFAPYTPVPFGNFLDQTETVAKLRWPQSVDVFEEMLNDAQLSALRDAVTLPIRRRLWSIDPNGAPDHVVEHLSADFGLPVHGQDAVPHDVVDGRPFDWTQHLFTALLAPFMGHYYFEQTVALGDDGLLHNDRIAPRPPRTLMQINVRSNGDLEWIRQKFGPSTAANPMIIPDPIPADRLVPYIWEPEGGNWVGRSMFRALYKHYLRKDAALRGDAQRNGRNSMGVPTIEAPQGATPQQMTDLARIAQSFRGGDYAGVALPYGAKLRLVGVEGSLPDIINSVRYDDEQMARRFLAMFIQLGQTKTGSRALGDSFIDFFALGLDAMADWVAACTVVAFRRIVTWNWGAGTRCPRLVSERDEDPELAATDLVAMVTAGIITVDPELEASIRERKGLPPIDPNTPRPTAPVPQPPAPTPSASTSRVGRPAGGNQRGRASTDTGPTSFVDWDKIDTKWQRSLGGLLNAWGDVQSQQIAEIESLIGNANGDLALLTSMQVTSRGADILASAMLTMADFGVKTATGEAKAQGVTLPDPWAENMLPSAAIGDILLKPVSALRRFIEDRSAAIAAVMARAIGEAASRHAVQRTTGETPAAPPIIPAIPLITPSVVPADAGPPLPAEVAEEVGEHLRNLSTAFLEEQLGRALTEGFNGGRRETLRGAPDGTRYEASALLDTNTCTVCNEFDGETWDTLPEGEHQFPVGGNKDCLGGPRCRCTLVGVYGEAAPSVQ